LQQRARITPFSGVPFDVDMPRNAAEEKPQAASAVSVMAAMMVSAGGRPSGPCFKTKTKNKLKPPAVAELLVFTTAATPVRKGAQHEDRRGIPVEEEPSF